MMANALAPKATKASVSYSPGMGQTRCRNCRHFLAPSACALVQGVIDPEYWCERFQPR